MTETTGGLRVGVFGTGALGQHHARVYAHLDGVRLVGVFDADPETARRVADAHGTRAFPSAEALAVKIEAASVAVPTDRHFEVAGALLDKGVHLLVEKPLAATTEEAETLVRQAEAGGCILQVGHIERFNPVLDLLEAQSGPPRFIEAHRLAPFPPARPGLAPRGTEVSVILDLMIHDIEVVLHLVRSPVSAVHAVGVPVLSPTEDIANVRLEFENRAVANLTASRISPEPMRKIRVFYDDAYLSLDYRAQAGEMHRRAPTGIVREPVPIEKEEPLLRELRSFAECVRRRDEPVVSGRQAEQALRLAVDIIGRVKARREG